MKRVKVIGVILTLMLLVMSCFKNEGSNGNFKGKVVKHDFGVTELKSEPKKIVILNNLYAEVLLPLGIMPIAATTGQAGSKEFASFVRDEFKKANVVSVGWQKKPDLEKIAELEPDLILMTTHQKDLYEKLSAIAPTIGFLMDNEKVWDFREPALKIADIFDKKAEMEKLIKDFDTKEAEFAKEVQAKYGNEKLVYLRVTEKDIRYYGYGRMGYLYDRYKFNRAEDFPAERMYESINMEKLMELNPDLLIVQSDKPELFETKVKETPIWNNIKAVKNNKIIFAEYSLWQLGFGLVSQEKIMETIKEAWFKN